MPRYGPASNVQQLLGCQTSMSVHDRACAPANLRLSKLVHSLTCCVAGVASVVLQTVAAALGEEEETVAKFTTENARAFFGLQV
jgi:hypothetical protein